MWSNFCCRNGDRLVQYGDSDRAGPCLEFFVSHSMNGFACIDWLGLEFRLFIVDCTTTRQYFSCIVEAESGSRIFDICIFQQHFFSPGYMGLEAGSNSH